MTNSTVRYETVQVDGLSIFYSEAGPKWAPTLLLLHGFPSSSRMFEPLLRRLSDTYHLIAPDYPGFGHSDAPDPSKFPYTFDHIASIINEFVTIKGISRYSLYVQDYGGPVGFRLALAHPERIESLIIQNVRWVAALGHFCELDLLRIETNFSYLVQIRAQAVC